MCTSDEKLLDEICRSRGWLLFLGIVGTAASGLYTIVLLVSGMMFVRKFFLILGNLITSVAMLWMSILALQAGIVARQIADTRDPTLATKFVNRVRLYFKVQGILVVMMIAAFLLFLLLLYFAHAAL